MSIYKYPEFMHGRARSAIGHEKSGIRKQESEARSPAPRAVQKIGLVEGKHRFASGPSLRLWVTMGVFVM
jgi:hypothetical protein